MAGWLWQLGAFGLMGGLVVCLVAIVKMAFGDKGHQGKSP
jgi:hypothetical protein